MFCTVTLAYIIIIIIIIIIILVIIFYTNNYVPETNPLSIVCSVVAVLYLYLRHMSCYFASEILE
jgi:hypothetical protein